MQLVENVEEHFLRLLATGEKLYIVKDQQVDLQIEILEILQPVILEGIQKLVREIVLIHVQYHLRRHAVLNLVSDRLYEVCLSYADAAVQHQWVERRDPGLLCHCKAGGTRKAVAIALDKVVESIRRIQSRIDVLGIKRLQGKRRIVIGTESTAPAMIDAVCWITSRPGRRLLVTAFDHNGILKPAVWTEHAVDCFFQHPNVIVLKPFIKELRRHLNRQHVAFDTQGNDGL